MSLQLALLIIVSGAALGLAMSKWHAFACADLERLRQQEHWVGRFSEGARALMRDSRVPDQFLGTLAGMNMILLDRSSCIIMFRLFSGPPPEGGSTIFRDDGTPFFEDDTELARAVSETLFAGLMAISYTDLRWGERMRGAMARLYRGEARVTQLASVAVREVSRSDHHLPSGLMPA